MSWTVYRHITPSGKSYIGITCRKPEKRWRNGNGYHKDTPFGCAIEKYKWENIQHNIVSTDLTEKEAKWLENYLICYYRTYVGFNGDCKGYNCTLGGEGSTGFKHTEESKLKMSNSSKGRTAWNKGIPRDEETKKKIGYSNKGKTVWNKGIPQSEETRRKNSEAHKGKTSPNKGKHRSEESKRKQSEAMKGKPSPMKGKKTGKPSPMKGKKTGKPAWNKGIPMSEEQKNKIIEKNKGMHRVYHEDGTFHMER